LNGYRIVHHLAPPGLSEKNERGEWVKSAYGPWVRRAFAVLARLKGLRGGRWDVFGKTDERRMERQLIADYRACVEELLQGLSAERLRQAAEVARIPEEIRGFGHVKERHVKAAREKWQRLMADWRTGRSSQT
jgi:indolepyruvate ferredoxin oxidoreductase